VWIGPGESRDVIFTAPAKTGSGAFDTYLLYDRSLGNLNNAGGSGLGGMITEIRVYPSGTSGSLGPQSAPNA
jgi:hypothetical protein